MATLRSLLGAMRTGDSARDQPGRVEVAIPARGDEDLWIARSGGPSDVTLRSLLGAMRTPTLSRPLTVNPVAIPARGDEDCTCSVSLPVALVVALRSLLGAMRTRGSTRRQSSRTSVAIPARGDEDSVRRRRRPG